MDVNTGCETPPVSRPLSSPPSSSLAVNFSCGVNTSLVINGEFTSRCVLVTSSIIQPGMTNSDDKLNRVYMRGAELADQLVFWYTCAVELWIQVELEMKRRAKQNYVVFFLLTL